MTAAAVRMVGAQLLCLAAMVNVVRVSRLQARAKRAVAEVAEREDAELRSIMAGPDRYDTALRGLGISAVDAGDALAAAFGAPPRPCLPFGQCPRCKSQGYHLFIDRRGGNVRRECRSCGLAWSESLVVA